MNATETLAEVRKQVVILAVARASENERLEQVAFDQLGELLGITEVEMNSALRVWQEHRPQDGDR